MKKQKSKYKSSTWDEHFYTGTVEIAQRMQKLLKLAKHSGNAGIIIIIIFYNVLNIWKIRVEKS